MLISVLMSDLPFSQVDKKKSWRNRHSHLNVGKTGNMTNDGLCLRLFTMVSLDGLRL
jgi:hypothetical protein